MTSGLVLPNRLAVAPMTNMQSLPDGSLGDDELDFLARRADGGFGLICTCAAFVAQDGRAWDGQLGIDRDELLPGLARLAERLRRNGATAMVQLHHGGVRAASRLTGEQVWSASTWKEDGKSFEVPRPATLADLERVIAQFAAAARRAQQAGFDGVELHAAHGYLLSQFLSATMNPRDDGWGGDAAGRARLVRTTMRAVRDAVGPRFTVGVRLSLEDFGYAKGLDLDEGLAVSRDLVADGADFIHASLWDFTAPTKKRPDAHAVTLLRAALPASAKIFAAGAVWSTADALALVERGADVIALGRSAILNPDWPIEAARSDWQPLRPPVTREQLAERACSPVFAQYLSRWKGFVV